MVTKFPQSEIIPAKTDVGALGNRINMATRDLHDKIDKLMTLKFALAIRDPKIYRQGIQLFYHLFVAIEKCLFREMENNTKYSEMLQNVYKPAMLRTEKLRQDLMFFYNDKPEKFEEAILPEQIEFVNHIYKTTADKPYLLLAYMHVLYLALFAGGRLMKSQVCRSLYLFPQVEGKSFEDIVTLGSNFYNFDTDDNESLRIIYKRDYELNTRNFLTEAEKQEIIDEAQYIFQMNATCVKEIENHNIKKIQSKLSYQIITKGYYVVLGLLMLFACYFLKRIAVHLLF
ncbi:unnamed protein product [[Candida] boidinii]|nr:hypothetical protein B5S30_g2983 [[Candida] boidinii]OWB85426.1 hypothetical protein B5S33_g4093 [[Candida] boidinii]GMF07303.1 unnamed protein product [[Candida] boidinii]GMF98636.1 unnamed protein product [[Candida] boidinii]